MSLKKMIIPAALLTAVLIVGKPATEKDNPDAVSGATTRNDFDKVVTLLR